MHPSIYLLFTTTFFSHDLNWGHRPATVTLQWLLRSITLNSVKANHLSDSGVSMRRSTGETPRYFESNTCFCVIHGSWSLLFQRDCMFLDCGRTPQWVEETNADAGRTCRRHGNHCNALPKLQDAYITEIIKGTIHHWRGKWGIKTHDWKTILIRQSRMSITGFGWFSLVTVVDSTL